MGSLAKYNILKDTRSAILRASVGNSLKLRLYAADTSTITDVAGAVSQWNDISGNGNHATQGTGSAQPTTNSSTQNNKNILEFDGGDYLVSPLGSMFSGSDKPFTIFTMSLNTSGAAKYIWNAGRASASEPLIGLRYEADGFDVLKRDDASVLVEKTGGSNVDGTPEILTVACAGTTISLNKNSTVVYTAQAFDVGTTTIDQFTIGALNIGGSQSNFLTGKIGEIVVYDRLLSAVEIADIEFEMLTGWGISI
ncbi:MAG: hypothetical protein ACUZ8H_03350 [Candidatus Anammoxibacter sp.]